MIPENVRPSQIPRLRQELADEASELITRSEGGYLSEEDDERFREIDADLVELQRRETEHKERVEVVRSHATNGGHTESGDGAVVRARSAQYMKQVEPFEVLRSSAGMNPKEIKRALVDSNLKAIEDRDLGGENEAHFERVLKRHAGDRAWASNILGRQREEYESAFSKMMIGRAELLDDIERTALQVGSNPLGGYLAPTHLDPTVVLSNSGTSNAVRAISRVVTLTEGNVWHGISSAGVSASFDAELTEVSDDSPTFAAPQVPLFMAKSFVRASLEMFRDISNLGADVMMLFADARDRLEGTVHVSGNGTTAPKGIVTALDANTNVEIISGTAASIALADLHNLYRQVPVRWRGRSTWLANPVYSLAIKALGTALSASYTTDLTQPSSGTLLGRPFVESDDMPTTQTTNVNDPEIILGDFSNFIVADKPGSMAVDLVSHLFSTTTNLPDGSRGWYCYWSNGSGTTTDLAFRLLLDKTG